MITQEQLPDVIGSTAYDADGDKIGRIGQVYYDDDTNQPKWITVHTGMFGGESFVPLQGAELNRDRVTVRYDKSRVKDAPHIKEDEHLSPDEEMNLYRHYGLDRGFAVDGRADGHRDGRAAEGRVADREPAAAGRSADREPAAAGRTGDDAMTRSEEHMRVGTESTEIGRARLRKHVVTEHQQVQVPVSHEEVRVEREPITDANRDAAYAGPEISEGEHEVTLHAERPVVSKETEPVERVRMGTERVRDEETVGGEVRREEIEVDDAGTRRRDRR